MRICCVPLCENKTSLRYSIPADPRIRDEWLQRINNKKLIGHTERLFLKNYKVCQDHFEDICIEPSGRIKKFAVPTLNIPGYEESSEENCLLIPHVPQPRTPERIKKIMSILPEGNSHLTDEALVVKKPEKYYPPSKKGKFILSHKVESPISESDDSFESTTSTS